jgi:hypothetical protein
MIYYEVIESCGNGSSMVRRFRLESEAIAYVEDNVNYCDSDYSLVDTESKYFLHGIGEEEEMKRTIRHCDAVY